MTARYPFTDPARDWARFTEDAGAWKPSGYDADMALRLAYYLDQQLPDTKAELQRRFPKTHDKMLPVTLPITRHFVRETAKVFLASTKLDLVQGDEPVEEGTAKWWERQKERAGLGLRLKRVDAYTTLFRTAGLRFSWTEAGFRAQVVFPQAVRVVMDPAAPMDIDRAHLVAMEIASDAGLRAGASRRWECWCARPGEEQHFFLEEGGDAPARITWRDAGGPLTRPDGTSMVPIVFFTAHTEELGLFTLEGADLVPANRGLNILVTDIHHIAEQQGFGVLVITAPEGADTPAEIIRSPNTAISLRGGTEASFINANAPIADLLDLADRRIKQAAVLYGIPAGAVSIEARAAASGIALQIENRPLLELRADSIETYRDPMRRMWEVIRALWNAYGEDAEVGDLDDVEARWTPGEVQTPTDDAARIDNILGRLKARLCTRAEAIAADRGISLEEAKKVQEEIDGERATPDESEDLDDPLGLAARRARIQRGEPEDEPVAPAAKGAAAAAVEGVVQDTALNGAQVSSLLEIATAVAEGSLPITTAEAMIRAAFPALPDALVTRIIAGLKGFEPKETTPPPGPPFPPPPAE